MTNMKERTPEIAKEYLEHYRMVNYGMMPEWVWDMAIRSLEQEPILDKIRSEIEEVYNDRPRNYNHTQRRELFCKVIEIINKYKAESEG